MADAKKCDRCGKYYDNNEYEFGGYHAKGILLLFHEYTCIDSEEDDEYNLCDDCLKEFIEVFMKGEKDD